MRKDKLPEIGRLRPRGAGFTLIELLVVIAIIAILAAMLLPALARAKSRAYAINDINNCKQSMVALNMYCTDNRDMTPQAGWDHTLDCWAASAGIFGSLGPTSVAGYQVIYNNQLQYFGGTGPAPSANKSGQLYPYLKNSKLLLCPEDNITTLIIQRAILLSSYVWNGALDGYTTGKHYKITAFGPTRIVQWEDDEQNVGNGATGAWNDFTNFPLETNPQGQQAPSFSKRHGKAAQIGRMDGSAGRETYVNISAWAFNTTAVNDLWCNPATISTTGH